MKDPVTLRVAFKYSGGFTPGSIASSANILGAGILVRRSGAIEQSPQALPADFDFGDGPEPCFPTPLGGIVLCYKSTGIINIEEFFQMALPASSPGPELLRVLQGKPVDQELGQSKILAEVTGADGSVARSIAIMPAGYMPTVNSAVEIVCRVLGGAFKPGFQSPASVYTEALLETLDVEIIDL